MSRRSCNLTAKLAQACLVIGSGMILASGVSAQQSSVEAGQQSPVESGHTQQKPVEAARTQQNPVETGGAHRPRVGLVLAGGGARGGAHIGVLKVLEDMHVPIDCIAGTSMGALVGGGYASGMPAREIEQFVGNIDWKSVIAGVGSRALHSPEQKRFQDTSGSLELGVKDGKVVTGRGLISTSRIEDVLRTFVARARSVADFDQLPIPYRAVATDMLTGNMVVLDHGDIATAMRASMAIPGAFAPVITDQYVLADGFVVRNLPIDVARQACADVVIAVNLVKAKVTVEQLANPLSLVSRANDVTMEANERQQLQTLTERDVRIDVDLGDITATDYERIRETVLPGEKAARAVADRLAKLAVSEQEYAAWRRRVTVQQQIKTQIADVEFSGLKRVNPEYLKTLTKVRPGDKVDTSTISADAARMAVVDDLDGVEYTLRGDPNNPDLVWEPREKEIGPDYLRPSMGLYTSGAGDLRFELSLQHVRRWLNSYGAQWRNRLQIGSNSLLETSLYQPLNISQTFFVEPGLLARRTLEDVYNKGSRVAQYHFVDLGGEVDAGANIAQNGQVRVGYWAYNRRTDVDTGIPLMPTVDTRDAGLMVTGTYDTRDWSSFATRGSAAEIQYTLSDSNLGAERNWQRLEVAARRAFPAGKTMLWVTAAGGSDLGSNLPPDQAFSLGGPQSFPGFAPGQVRARGYWTVDGSFLWRLGDIMPIASQTLYGGFSVQGGWSYNRVDEVSNGALYGVSAYLGGRTPVGTVALGVGKATDAWAVWITIGTPVGTGSILNGPLFR